MKAQLMLSKLHTSKRPIFNSPFKNLKMQGVFIFKFSDFKMVSYALDQDEEHGSLYNHIPITQAYHT